ncbi:MAG: hypothetical protein LBQ59_01290 [Candidatus Peribacteria bacterium]|jgi:hypothetical protein|nr:hypothetical protein [Candidatus Peribacteria bacterium]
MKEKFGQAENVIKMHPAIPDKAEKTMLFQLEFLKYSSDMSNGGDFDKKVISLIGPYIDVNDFNDITRLQIKPEEFIDEKQLLSLKNQAINLYNTSSDAINGSLKTYLSYTTE